MLEGGASLSTYYYLFKHPQMERAEQTKMFTDLTKEWQSSASIAGLRVTLYGASTHMVDGTTVPVAAPHTHTATQCCCETSTATATRRTSRTVAPHTVIWARSPEPHSGAVLYNHDSSTSVHTALYLYCIQNCTAPIARSSWFFYCKRITIPNITSANALMG